MNSKCKNQNELISEMEYENKIVVFIDILGFKELVNKRNIVSIYKQLEKLYEVDSLIRNDSTLKNLNAEEYKESLRINTFSDSVIISCGVLQSGLILPLLMDFQIELLKEGVYIRGCISEGRLHHNEQFLFGPSLIDAYLKESNLANYPRIILSDTYQRVGTYFCEDYDGIYFIDFCNRMKVRDENDSAFCLNKTIELIYKNIENELNDEVIKRKPRIISKYAWLKKLLNENFYFDGKSYKYYYPSNSTYSRVTDHIKLRNAFLTDRMHNKNDWTRDIDDKS